jgi:hypothetical protein
MESFLQVCRWGFRFDAEATRALYAQTSGIDCTCTDCANFRAAGDAAYSPPFLHLLMQLGIDPYKPAELSHYGNSGEPMQTHGWFHFVGRLEHGLDAWRQVRETSYTLENEPYPGIKGIGFTARLSQVPEPFEASPLVQIEFETVVPWVTAVPLA